MRAHGVVGVVELRFEMRDVARVPRVAHGDGRVALEDGSPQPLISQRLRLLHVLAFRNAQSFLSLPAFLEGPSFLRLRFASRLTVLVATPSLEAIDDSDSPELSPASMVRLMLASRWRNRSSFLFICTSDPGREERCVDYRRREGLTANRNAFSVATLLMPLSCNSDVT